MGPLNQTSVSQRCHNYGCIYHHLFTSDHSPIYAGLRLRCSITTKRPPNEFNDHGYPRKYVVLIKNVQLIRPNGQKEYPKSFRVLFPAPFEVSQVYICINCVCVFVFVFFRKIVKNLKVDILVVKTY